MSLMEKFANPDTFSGLSMGERLQGATITMCMGLGITFAILILLWVIIAIMAKVTAGKKAEQAVTAAPAPAPAPAAEEIPVDEADNAELVAVIAAAIAASENTYVSNLVVRRITRISGTTNAWNSAGRGECIDSRRM